MKIRFLLIASLFLPSGGWSALVVQSLWVNAGTFVTVDTVSMPSLAFNDSPVFSPRNAVISLRTGDHLHLKVFNNDSVAHGFAVKNLFATVVLAPGDSLVTSLAFHNQGVFIYYDSLEYPRNCYLGAAGMITVAGPGQPDREFWWNFREHRTGWNDSLLHHQAVNWNAYNPDYFTINGLSKPDLQTDATAALTGNVGDSIYIYMANTGLSVHPIHFHGYHCRILSASKDPVMNGWEKDTFPLWPMETMLIVMVPDKPGLFPVHDHNLFSQTGGHIYNNGMFIMMQIN